MNGTETDPVMGAGLKQTQLNICQQLPSPKEQNQNKKKKITATPNRLKLPPAGLGRLVIQV